MKKIADYLLIALLIFLLVKPASADKGLFSFMEDAQLTQGSQKAIILHNFKEEALILGTELRANKETEVLEFIPFPSEPEVSLAKGNPFEEVNKLLRKKRIEIQEGITKGGAETVPVEIRLSQKIGLHDVTVIKINDISGFNKWVFDFLKSKGIKKIDIDRLKNFSDIAEDYIKRGISYFVFDYVSVKKNLSFIEPLIYKFKTERLYYPLKTSNIVGGVGRVELVMILPGTLGIKEDEKIKIKEAFPKTRRPELSSSSKVYIDEIKPIYENSEEFFKNTKKIYLQMLIYEGRYEFRDDLNLDISGIAPYARKISNTWGYPHFLDDFTLDELNDYFEAHPELKKWR